MSINIFTQTFRSPHLMQLANEASRFLESTPKHVLPISAAFNGVGVYALYYNGRHESYVGLAKKPIYIGKAVPTGARAGAILTREEPKLKNRLNEHVRSIQQASNLDIVDFKCQFIIIPLEISAIIPVVETALIKKYQPVWNTKIDGFGNHDPGKGRYKQARSQWDKLHPGRRWAEKLNG
jgi:hypothetical protein